MTKSKYFAWHKSSYSDGTGNCVEVARAQELVAVRDTKLSAHGAVLEFSQAAWREFLAAAKSDKADG